MRALCLALALALCCVSYAAADGVTVDKLEGSELDAPLPTVGERNYILTNMGPYKVTVTTVKFTITGIQTGAGQDPVMGAFFVDGEIGPVYTEKEFTADVATPTAEHVEWDQTQLTASSKITYQVYTVDANGKLKDTLASTAELPINVLELKTEKPESVSIVRDGCEVEFNMLGIYSKPAMRTFCGLMEDGKLLADLTDPAADEGVIAFDSITWTKDAENTKWAPKPCTDDSGDAIDECAAWELTEGKLNVKETAQDKPIGAACQVWVDGQTEFKEYEVKQVIEVPAKHRCPANPLTDFAANKTDVKYKALQTVRNCWTEEDSDIAAEMSCTGEGKTENSFTVYCEDGAYKAYSGSKDKAEAWNEDKATAWADETCGTAGILPMSLLVGALALFASRA